MNKTTARVVTEILRNPEAWDKKAGAPRVKWINDQLHVARELLFYDEIYFPYMRRFMIRAMARGIFKPEEVQTITVGYNLEFEILYPIDADCQETLGYLFQRALGKVWDGEDWCFEEITATEILSLGVLADNTQLVLYEASNDQKTES